MARPTTISTQQIIDAARSLFMAQGYGVSTASIAAEVGISEGSIFKRFPSKPKLFQAAMDLPELDIDGTLAGMTGTGDVCSNLLRIAEALLVYLRKMVPRLMMLWAHPPLNPVDALKDNPDAPPRKAVAAIGAYLASEVEAGRVRCHDTQVAARMLLSALHSYVFFRLIGIIPPEGPSDEDYLRQVVDVLWKGLAP